jgi:hypothetical protein
MRSSTVRLGEFLIFVGVFVLALQYIDWGAFAPLELADFVIAGGVALLICFVLALWSRSLLFDELLHLIALIIGAAALGLIVSGSGASAWVNAIGPERAEKTVSFDGSFSPDPATLTVTLDLQNGSATVQTWEQETFQMTVTARARAWSEKEAQKILSNVMVEPRLSPTEISFRAPRSSFGFFSSTETNIQVHLPRGRVYELKLTSVNGALNVQEVNAAVADLSTVNGRIRLNTLTAQRVTLHTVNGAISGQVSSSEATASTTNGSIDLILGSVTGSYEFSALNGSIELDVPDDSEIGYSISAQSVTSRVRVQVPNFVYRQQERRRVEGATDNFESATTKVTIRANTTNGGIEIR